MRQEIAQVAGTQEACEALLTLRNTILQQQGLYVSDRSWSKVGKVLRAYAWYCGDSSIYTEHLACLASVFWHNPNQENDIKRIIYQIACPLNIEAMQVVDIVQSLYDKLPASTDSMFNAEAENLLQGI